MGGLKNYAGGHLGEHINPVLVQTPVAKAATFQTPGLDRRLFGIINWAVLIGAASPDGGTLDLTVQDSADNVTFANFAASTQVNFGAVVVPQILGTDDDKLFEIVTDLRKAKRFIRMNGAIAGGGTFLVGITGILGGHAEGLPV